MGLRRESTNTMRQTRPRSPVVTPTPIFPPMASWVEKVSVPTPRADGKVRTQATIIRPKTGQRISTLASMPEPTTELVQTCVVESGKPRYEEVRMVAADEVSAANP